MLQYPKEVEVERYDKDDYDNMLDEVYTEVTIGGSTFSPSQVLKECDPTGYRVGFADYQEYDTMYECPICGEQHDDEDDALECCQEVYECPECYEKYDNEADAESCCAEDDEEEDDEE